VRCHDAQKGTRVDKRKPKEARKEGNVPRRDLKKEGKKNKETITTVCLCSKGQLGATVAEATGAAAINF